MTQRTTQSFAAGFGPFSRQGRGVLAVFSALALAAAAAVLLMPGPAGAANGADFRAGNIIDDGTFTNKNTMSIPAIQSFLNQKVPACDTNGDKTIYDGTHGDTVTRRQFSQRRGINPPFTCLRDYHEHGKSAAQIIWEKSQDFSINPQVLIVLLQKEQALVTDDWPWPVQYRTATGYGCPDTAACDSQYYGFTNQVHLAAQMFRRIMNGGGFNYYPPGVNNVLYNPNHACGSSPVTIQNRATSALYNYTPYQPNAAALNNLYGTGDGCSAYGNRNFWRDFNDWFGPSSGEGFTLARSSDPNDLRQWVIYYGLKQLVPSAEIIHAWGLQNTPLVTFSPSTLNGIPTGPTLGRLMKTRDSSTVYLVDNGKRYAVASPEMLDAWNLRGAVLSTVSRALATVPGDGGPLTYAVRKDGTNAIYRVSGVKNGNVVLNPYPSMEMFMAWEGDNPRHNVVSADLFNSLDNAIEAAVSAVKINHGGAQYMVNSGRKMTLTFNVAHLYPGGGQDVLPETFKRLVPNGPATPFIRVNGAPDVYLVDGGTRRLITNPFVLDAWNAANLPINVVNGPYASLVPAAGGSISRYLARAQNGQAYLVDNRKLPVPQNLQAAYGAGDAPVVSDHFLATLPDGPTLQPHIKAAGKPAIYMLENGTRRPFGNMTDFTLWTNGGHGFSELPDRVVESLPLGSFMSAYVSNNGANYLIDSGKRHTVSAAVAAAFGLPAPAPVADSTLAKAPAGDPFTDPKLKVGNDLYWLHNKTGWRAPNQLIANLWHLDGAPSASAALLNKLAARGTLGRFVRSTDPADQRIMAVDDGKLYTLSNPAMVWSLGYTGSGLMSITPGEITSRVQPAIWQFPLARDGDGGYFVLDAGTKRPFANLESYTQWTDDGQLNVPAVSESYLGLLPNGGPVGKSVKGSGPDIYAVTDGRKQWIRSGATYNQSYAPFTTVSNTLLEALPNGTQIP